MIARSVFCSVLVVTAALALSRGVSAQTTPETVAPAAIQIEGVTVTNADIHQFLVAMHHALQPNDMTVPVFIDVKKPSEMPAYDLQVHYVGIQQRSGQKVLMIWVNETQTKSLPEDAMVGAFSLAVTDGGYAGSAFKQLYDINAAKDAQLPAGTPDPYLNRHRFAAAMAQMLSGPKASPSP